MKKSLDVNSKRILQITFAAFRSLRWIDWAMIVFFSSRFFTAIFTSTLGTKGVFVTMLVLAFLYLMSLIQAWQKNEMAHIYLFFLLVFMVTLLAFWTMSFNPEAREWMLDFDYGLITRTFDVRKGIFGAFVLLMVADPTKMLKNFKISVWFSFLYLLLQAGIFIFTGNWDHYFVLQDNRSLTYNLTFGYEMIFVAIVFMAIGFHFKEKRYKLLGLLGFVLAFIFGSRGSVIPFIAFMSLLGIKTIWTYRRKWQHQIKFALLIGIVIVILTSVLLVFNRKPTGTVGKGEEQSSFTTGIRNIDMLLTSDFANDNGRINIWRLSWEGIKDKFPFGYGVYGDRPFVGQKYEWGYSHNVLLELIISFGIAGVFLIFLLLFKIIRNLFNDQNQEISIILMILTAMNAKLLISDSFWYYEFFWALVGLLLLFELDKSGHLISRTLLSQDGRIRPGAKGLITLVISANILLAGLVINDLVKGQKFNPVVFTEPTVILAFQGMNKESMMMGLEEMSRRGYPVSAFTNLEKISADQIRILDTFSQPDWHIALETMPLSSDNQTSIDRYIEYNRPSLQALRGEVPFSLSTMQSFIEPEILQHLRQSADALILPAIRYGNYYYRSLSQDDFYKIGAMNASINHLNHSRRMPFVKKQIDLAKVNNGLIVIYFRDLELYTDPTFDIEGTTAYSNFTRILDYLESGDFRFTTISALTEEGRFAEKEKTLRNLFMNSEIYRKIKSIL